MDNLDRNEDTIDPYTTHDEDEENQFESTLDPFRPFLEESQLDPFESQFQNRQDLEVEPEFRTTLGDLEAVSTDDAVGLYFRQMAQEPLLTAEMEIELSRRIQLGFRAQDKLQRGYPLNQPGRPYAPSYVKHLMTVETARAGSARTPRPRQYAARHQYRQEIHEPGHALPRPHPGGEYRPDARGR